MPRAGARGRCARRIADALAARRDHRALADALLERLAAIDLPAGVPWRWAAAGLLGELRGAVRVLGRLDERDTEPTAELMALPGHERGERRAALKSALLTLGASAGTSTEAGRHALRLAVVAAIGEIVAQASGLPHGYLFAEGGETAGRVLSGSLRSLRPPADMPPLRQMQTALYDQLTGPGQVTLAGLDAILVAATDEFTDALDSAADILHRQLSTDEDDDSAAPAQRPGPDLAGA